MQVILLEKIRGLGDLGTVVKVADGFARNYLIPEGKAIVASQNNQQRFEARRQELEQAARQRLAQAQERMNVFQGLTVSLAVQASDDGRLYGSVGPADVAKHLKDKGIEATRQEIHFPQGAIRELGIFEIVVQLHPELSVPMTLEITQAS